MHWRESSHDGNECLFLHGLRAIKALPYPAIFVSYTLKSSTRSMFKMMDTVQSLPDVLSPPLVLLLLSALILEWYNLVSDLLPKEQLDHRSAFTRLSIRPLYH